MYNKISIYKLYFLLTHNRVLDIKKELFYRLSTIATRRGSSSVESRHSFRHDSYVLLPSGTRIRYRKVEDLHGVSPRRKLVCYIHSQMPGSILRSRASNRQRILDRLLERYLSRTGDLSVLRGIRVSFRKANGKDFMPGGRKMGEEAVVFRCVKSYTRN